MLLLNVNTSQGFLGSLGWSEWTINGFWVLWYAAFIWLGSRWWVRQGGGRIVGGVIGFFAGFVTFLILGAILRTILN